MLTEKQMAMHNSHIGSSEVASAIGVNPWQTPYELWMLKTGRAEKTPENDAMWWGSNLEDVIAARYEVESGNKTVKTENTYYQDGYEFLVAHPDRLIPDQDKLLEIKTSWHDESWVNNIPEYYKLQCQAQMFCVGKHIKSVDLCVFYKNACRIEIFNVARSEETIELIKQEVKAFWEFNVGMDIEPDIKTLNDLKFKFPTMLSQECAIADEEDLKNISEYKRIKEQLKSFEIIKDNLQLKICEKIGDKNGIKFCDQVVATWKSAKNGSRRFSVKE